MTHARAGIVRRAWKSIAANLTAPWLEAAAAVILVFVTGYYAYWTKQQWRAATDSVEATREAYRLAQRAWLGPSPDVRFHVRVAPSCDASSPDVTLFRLPKNSSAQVCVFITNTGSTPALNVRHKTAVAFVNDQRKMLGQPEFVPDTAIFPKATISFASEASAPLPDVKEEIEAALRNHQDKPGLFVVATVCYEDIFGDLHFTRTCRVMGQNDPGQFDYCENDTVDLRATEATSVCGEKRAARPNPRMEPSRP